MKTFLVLILVISCSHHSETKKQTDPLASWNDTSLKKSILSFVKDVTNSESKNYIPPEDRIATFDNDGTLWAEQPPIQAIFTEAIAQKKGFKHKPLKDMNEKQLLDLVLKTNTGMSADDYYMSVKQFFDQGNYNHKTYLPQIELIRYLTQHGFKVYISSGGTVDFMRVISRSYYGIPEEQVIGTSFEYDYDEKTNTIFRKPKIVTINDGESKAHNIQRIIGKRPVFACGNVRSGGDVYMLRFSQGSRYKTFQLMINHDDAEREFSYQEKDNKSLNWAKQYQWNVLSIKDDWKKIFPDS